jgi:CubicO group peptidase (beta-lactamase class C family)
MHTRSSLYALVALIGLALLALIFIPRLIKSNQLASQTYWPTQGWRTSTPEEQGFDSEKLLVALQAIQSQYVKIDSLLIIRNGNVILDAYFYPYDGKIVHDLASVTKSFTTTLIGIAIGQGKLDRDQKLVSIFPDRAIANLDERKEQITVRHLASNLNGLSSGCIQSDEGTLNTMRADPDWVQSALDRKVVWDPGTHFCYDSPGMHLLSAILQETTGMTELEFARKYLFEPLGITEAIWESDPQGYTHGWGDLHLKPLDAAKLGYLWLNNGVWEGEQVVPVDWVKDSVTGQHESGAVENYGYGWWVTKDNYHAMGRDGQYIYVYPAANVIVVATGAGFSMGQIEQYLVASFVDPEQPLPANPEGNAKLNALVASLEDGPLAQPSGPLPETAKAISGNRYVFEANPLELETLSLDFSDPAQASLHLTSPGSDEMLNWPIGLDGNYRLTEDGQGQRGVWEDSQTFTFQVFDIGCETYQLHFDQDRVTIESLESGMSLEGQLESP